MSVKSQVQAAEEALRQALINALAEGDEEYLSELFAQYQAVGDLNRKVYLISFCCFGLFSFYRYYQNRNYRDIILCYFFLLEAATNGPQFNR